MYCVPIKEISKSALSNISPVSVFPGFQCHFSGTWSRFQSQWLILAAQTTSGVRSRQPVTHCGSRRLWSMNKAYNLFCPSRVELNLIWLLRRLQQPAGKLMHQNLFGRFAILLRESLARKEGDKRDRVGWKGRRGQKYWSPVCSVAELTDDANWRISIEILNAAY